MLKGFLVLKNALLQLIEVLFDWLHDHLDAQVADHSRFVVDVGIAFARYELAGLKSVALLVDSVLLCAQLIQTHVVVLRVATNLALTYVVRQVADGVVAGGHQISIGVVETFRIFELALVELLQLAPLFKGHTAFVRKE